MRAALRQTWLTTIPFLFLFLLTGCAAGPGLPGLIALFVLLTFFAACRPMLDEDRTDEFLLRAFLRDSSDSSASTASCSATVDYTQSFDLSTVDPATAGIGFKISGPAASSNFGFQIDGGGDFNGDGVGDILVSAYSYNSSRGRVFVLFGRTDGADIDTASMSASDGITITGESNMDQLGRHGLGFAGDVNGDGYDDILAGAYEKNAAAGEAYLIFGGPSPGDLTMPPASVSEGVRFVGAANYGTGRAAYGLGDINGDDVDDFAISSYYGPAPYRGRTHVVYGKSGGFSSASVSIASITAGDGFYIAGESNGDYFGQELDGLGDLNGDGVGDLLVGSNSIGGSTGAAYVIYGSSGTRSDIDLSGGLGSNGFKLSGTAGGLATGLAGSGDFNGDGQSDFALGAPTLNSNDGRIALLYGDVGDLSLGVPAAAQGLVIDGSSAEGAGQAVALGDVNDDGLDDLLVGAYRADFGPTDSGSAYLVFGQSGIPNSGASFSSYTGGSTGIRIDGMTASGQLGDAVQIADVNGDLCPDILLGQHNAGNGYTFVIYGGKAE